MKIKISLLLFLFIVSLRGAIQWTQKTDMPTGRDGLGIGVVHDTVYCIGGWTAGNPNTATGIVEAYDPATDSWRTKTSMPTPRGFLAVCVLNNKIYALGGWNASSTGLTTAEVYDPASDTWASLPPMQMGRNGLGAETVNGKIYAIGGFLGETAVVEEYDTLLSAWAYKTPMPTTRFFFASEVVSDEIYILGGRSGGVNLGPTYIYEPAADTTGGAPWQTGASIPTPRYHPEAGVVYGAIYVCGGLADSDLICGAGEDSRPDVAVVEAYITLTDTWTTEYPMLAARRELDVGVVANCLYAIGGWPVAVSNRNEEGLIYTGVEENNMNNYYIGHDLTPTILAGSLHLPTDKNCKIFDITGRVVLPQQMKTGVYFVEIDNKIVQKIVKIR
jgi:hypothetical protein